MNKINNITDLRNFALNTLMDLKKRKIDIKEAATCAAVISGVISTVKTQLDYHKMIDTRPNIDFLESKATYQIENDSKESLALSHDEEDSEGDYEWEPLIRR